MDTKISVVDGHHGEYDFEFDEPVSLIMFCGWAVDRLKEFSFEKVGKNGYPRPLHEWIGLFLSWSGYTDYQDRK